MRAVDNDDLAVSYSYLLPFFSSLRLSLSLSCKLSHSAPPRVSRKLHSVAALPGSLFLFSEPGHLTGLSNPMECREDPVRVWSTAAAPTLVSAQTRSEGSDILPHQRPMVYLLGTAFFSLLDVHHALATNTQWPLPLRVRYPWKLWRLLINLGASAFEGALGGGPPHSGNGSRFIGKSKWHASCNHTTLVDSSAWEGW